MIFSLAEYQSYELFSFWYCEIVIVVVVQIRKLDDTEFKNPWARGYIRVWFLLAILVVYVFMFALF